MPLDPCLVPHTCAPHTHWLRPVCLLVLPPGRWVPITYTSEVSWQQELWRLLPTLLLIGGYVWFTRRQLGGMGGIGERTLPPGWPAGRRGCTREPVSLPRSTAQRSAMHTCICAPTAQRLSRHLLFFSSWSHSSSKHLLFLTHARRRRRWRGGPRHLQRRQGAGAPPPRQARLAAGRPCSALLLGARQAPCARAGIGAEESRQLCHKALRLHERCTAPPCCPGHHRGQECQAQGHLQGRGGLRRGQGGRAGRQTGCGLRVACCVVTWWCSSCPAPAPAAGYNVERVKCARGEARLGLWLGSPRCTCCPALPWCCCPWGRWPWLGAPNLHSLPPARPRPLLPLLRWRLWSLSTS